MINNTLPSVSSLLKKAIVIQEISSFMLLVATHYKKLTKND